jgi:phenylpropionate dioxygenase-like ring-hydroxylating dioxygenase large terminal subunit
MSDQSLLDDPDVVERIFNHIDNKTTDLGHATWREPVDNYLSEQRLRLELELMRRSPVPLCPSAALPEPGSYVAREAAGTPLLAVRGGDGQVRVFRNACRHRGTALAGGDGCRKAFVCPYHGWTYGLDGALRHVPHEHGFPGLDKDSRGLVAVACAEAQGLVVVRQTPAAADESPDPLPSLIPSDYRLCGSSDDEVPVNWKIFAEGFLEGYHIRSTHSQTFYPRQYDNLNVVERFGRNNRIAFPYRAVEKLREVPRRQRIADGVLTYVYHLFPNVMIATFPRRIIMVVLEPVSVDRTRTFTYNLSNRADDEEGQSTLRRDADFVSAGAREDREMACAIQRGLATGANRFLEFGRFESAIEHFHAELHEAVERVRQAHAG